MLLFGLSTVPALLFFLRLCSLFWPTTHPPSSSVSPYLRHPRPDTGVKHVHAYSILFLSIILISPLVHSNRVLEDVIIEKDWSDLSTPL